MQQLKIVGIPPTLNEIRRMHHFEQAQHKKRWEQLVLIEVKVQKLQPVSVPVIVTYRFHFKDARRRDRTDMHTAQKLYKMDSLRAAYCRMITFVL